MSTITYSCPNCGAHIEHNIAAQNFDCTYCGSVFSLEQVQAFSKQKQDTNFKQAESDLNKEKLIEEFKEGVLTYTCKQCGAEIVSEKNTVSTYCLYCHSPNIIQSRLIEDYSPDKVLPFKIDEAQAKEQFLKLANGVAFLPKNFTDEEHLKKMSGLYAPFWLYDVRGEFDVSGIGHKTKSWTTGQYRYTQVDRYQFHKKGSVQCIKIPVDASKSLNNRTMQQLEPFDYGELKAFDIAYLSGHYAEKYDDSKEALYPDVEKAVQEHVEKQTDIVVNTAYGKKQIENRLVEVKQDNVDYAFLPIWFLNYQFENQDYAFTMNGQTGKVVGYFPLDKTLRRTFFFKTAAVAFVVLFLITGLAVMFE